MAARISEAAFRKMTGATAPKKRPLKGASAGNLIFLAMCMANGLPDPVPEHRFHDVREWRFDWAWLEQKVALEIDGGAWTKGRHTRGKGFIEDQAKMNRAIIMGWQVLHCTPTDVEDGSIFALLREMF